MPFERSLTAVALAPGVGGRVGLALVSLGITILVWGCGSGSDSAARPGPSPSDEAVSESPTLSLEAPSELGHYRIGARPAVPPVGLHQMHDWIVRIEHREGNSEIPTAIHFDGGMPSHGHGFVTQPRVTQNLGDGEFLVEGVKFHMPGAWVLRITVTSRTKSDRATLPVTITP